MNYFLAIFYNFRQQRLRAAWRLGLHLLATLAALLGVMIGASLLALWTDLNSESSLGMIIGGWLQGGTLILSVLAASWMLDRRRLVSLGWDRSWRLEALVGFALGVVAMLWIFAIELQLGWIEVIRVGVAPDAAWTTLLASQAGWLSLMLVVGISEELLSRGYHLKNLAEGFRRLGKWPAMLVAVILSSAFFGILHGMNPNATWTSNVGVALAGVMLATGRIATGSLAAPIGLHISWNWMQGPVLGFPVSGHAMEHSLVKLVQGGDPLWTGSSFGPEAGLLGFIAVGVLTIAFLVWGRAKHRPTRYVAALVHYRRRAAAPRLATVVEEPREDTRIDPRTEPSEQPGKESETLEGHRQPSEHGLADTAES